MATQNDKTTSASLSPKMDVVPNLNKLETIRDILFGSQIEVMERELAALREVVANQQKTNAEAFEQSEMFGKQVVNTINELRGEVVQKMEENHVFLLKEISRLDNDKTDRDELGRILIDLGKKLIKNNKN